MEIGAFFNTDVGRQMKELNLDVKNYKPTDAVVKYKPHNNFAGDPVVCLANYTHKCGNCNKLFRHDQITTCTSLRHMNEGPEKAVSCPNYAC